MAQKESCSKSRCWLIGLVAALLFLPVILNGWPQMFKNWGVCSRVSSHLKNSDAAFSEGDYGLAMAEANRARQLEPQNAAAQNRVSRARIFLLGWNPEGLANMDIGELRADIAIVEKAFAADKATVTAFKGMLAYAQAARDEADKHFNAALALDENNGLAHFGLAVALLNQREIDQNLVEHLKVALEARPNQADLHVFMGNTMQTLGDLKAAEEAYAKATAIRANTVWLTKLARVQMMQNEAEKAVLSAQKALMADENNQAAWLILGQSFLAGKKHQEAIGALQHALSMQENQDVLFNLGLAYNSAQLYSEALPVFNRMVQAGNRDPVVMSELAIALEGTNNVPEAVKIYTALVQMTHPQPESPQGMALAQIVERAKNRLAALQGGGQ